MMHTEFSNHDGNISVYVLTYISAELDAIWCKIPNFLNHILHITQTPRTRYDVTQVVYGAFIDHLLVGTCILIKVDAEFNANRAKTAPSRNFHFQTDITRDH